jgi:peptidoglycan hydrolase CwlO-like protein
MLLNDEIEKYKYQIYILQNDIDKLNDRLNIRNYMYNVKF